MYAKLIILTCLVEVFGKDISSLNHLGPNDFNYHPLEVKQLIKNNIAPTQKGPVLFPNDAPPPPKTPLIVTSRPLLESIARSELNPNPSNSTTPTPQPYRLNRLKFLRKNPLKSYNVDSDSGFLDNFETEKARTFDDEASQLSHERYTVETGRANSVRHKDAIIYDDNFESPVVLINHYAGKPSYDYNVYREPYSSKFFDKRKDIRYHDEEEPRQVLPPIYKAIGDFAKKNLLRIQENNRDRPKFKVKEEKDYQIEEPDESENDIYSDDDNANYAFSYKVKDQKTGDDFSHSQRSSGSATNGEYRVRLPDGRMQIVSYTADENGYKADVRYDDAPVNDDHHSDKTSRHEPKYSQKHKDPYTLKNAIINYNTEKPYSLYSQNYNEVYNTNDLGNRRDLYNGNDYSYPDLLRDYNTEDYAIDYGDEVNYEPHKSKFTHLAKNNKESDIGVIYVPNYEKSTRVTTTVRPLLQELRNIFAPRRKETQIPVEIKVPSTTAAPETHDTTTEEVVLIGGKSNLYTNVKHSLPNFPSPTQRPFYQIFSTTTQQNPQSYTTTNSPFQIFSTTNPTYQSYTRNPQYQEFSVTQQPQNGFSTTEPSYQRFSTTAQPYQRFSTTEKPYQRFSTTNLYQSYTNPTSSSLLLSTEAPIKNIDFSGNKPVLSRTFIDKVNKYLSF